MSVNTYIVQCNKIENNSENIVISGTSSVKAAKTYFNKNFVKIPLEKEKEADVVLIRGDIRSNGKIRFIGKCTRICLKVNEFV